jgi:hypothetical protein
MVGSVAYGKPNIQYSCEYPSKIRIQHIYFGVLRPVARTLSRLLEEPSLATPCRVGSFETLIRSQQFCLFQDKHYQK